MNFSNRLEYLNSFFSEESEFFSIFNILEAYHKIFSESVKLFWKNKYQQAIDSFKKSINYNPFDTLIYWNLARLGVITKQKKLIMINYTKAKEMAVDKTIRMKIINEIKLLKTNIEYIPKVPVTFDQL